MYKYIYKGHDRVSVHIGSNEDVDEGVSNEVPKKIDEIKIFQMPDGFPLQKQCGGFMSLI